MISSSQSPRRSQVVVSKPMSGSTPQKNQIISHEALEADRLALISTVSIFTHDVAKLQNVLFRTFRDIQDLIEIEDKIAAQSLKKFHKTCYKTSVSFKNDIASALNELSTQNLTAIESEDALAEHKKQKLHIIGLCLQLLDKHNKFYAKLKLEMGELIPRPHQDIFMVLCNCICKELNRAIEAISSEFYHPLALTVDSELIEIHKQVTAISELFNVLDEKLKFIQDKVKQDNGKNAIQGLRKILASVLLNGTIHEKDLLKVTTEIKKIFCIIKKCAPDVVTPLVDSIFDDLQLLQTRLSQWKLSGPAYYAAVIGRYGIPLALGVITTLIPAIPDVSSFLMETGGLAGAAMGSGADAIIAGQVLVDQGACATLSTAGIAVECVVEEKVVTHRNKAIAPHVIHNGNEILVSSEHLWKETILKELVLKWVEKNQADLAMTVVGLTASAVTIPLTATGVLAPVSASIIMGAVAGAKLSLSAAASVHDARKLAEAEKALMQLTLTTLDKCYKKFARWNDQSCQRFFSHTRSTADDSVYLQPESAKHSQKQPMLS